VVEQAGSREKPVIAAFLTASMGRERWIGIVYRVVNNGLRSAVSVGGWAMKKGTEYYVVSGLMLAGFAGMVCWAGRAVGIPWDVITVVWGLCAGIMLLAK